LDVDAGNLANSKVAFYRFLNLKVFVEFFFFLVSSFFAEVTQQIHSFLPSGVSAFHFSFTSETLSISALISLGIR
jgi:hypothetical protein